MGHFYCLDCTVLRTISFPQLAGEQKAKQVPEQEPWQGGGRLAPARTYVKKAGRGHVLYVKAVCSVIQAPSVRLQTCQPIQSAAI
jgi:hypothetical protein